MSSLESNNFCLNFFLKCFLKEIIYWILKNGTPCIYSERNRMRSRNRNPENRKGGMENVNSRIPLFDESLSGFFIRRLPQITQHNHTQFLRYRFLKVGITTVFLIQLMVLYMYRVSKIVTPFFKLNEINRNKYMYIELNDSNETLIFCTFKKEYN